MCLKKIFTEKRCYEMEIQLTPVQFISGADYHHNYPKAGGLLQNQHLC